MPSSRFLVGGLKSFAIILLSAGSLLLFAYPASHDELHFCHGAWLAHIGLHPFSDFLWHNSTGIIYILRFCSLWNAELGPEVILWGRLLCVISLWATAFALYEIGTLVHGKAVGAMAIIVAVPLWMLPRNADLFYKPHWCIRPEILVMPLAFGSLYLTLLLTRQFAEVSKKAEGIQDLHRTANWAFAMGCLASGMAGIALFVSPRLIHMCFALLMVAVLWRRSIPRAAIAGMLVGAVVAPLFYFCFIGPSDSYTWIMQYATSHRPENHARFGAFRAHIGKGVMLVALVSKPDLFVAKSHKTHATSRTCPGHTKLGGLVRNTTESGNVPTNCHTRRSTVCLPARATSRTADLGCDCWCGVTRTLLRFLSCTRCATHVCLMGGAH